MIEKNHLQRYDFLLEIGLMVCIIVPHLFIILSHQTILLDWFNTDDAFYYYKTAQNIVEGKGFTFDGFGRTNGFQPLWLFVLMPVFLIIRGDLITPLRLVIGLQVLLSLGTALVLFRAFQQYCAKYTAFLLALAWSLLSGIHAVTTQGGMESGINTFFIILLWSQASKVIAYFSNADSPLKSILGFSGLAVLALLSRLDNVFLVYIMGAWVILRLLKASAGKRGFAWRRLVEFGIAFFAPLTAVLGGYMLVNKIYFGSFMPVSGTIKRWWGTLDYTVYGRPPEDLPALIKEVFSENGNLGPFAGIVKAILSLKESLANTSEIVFGLLMIILLVLIGILVYFQWDFVKKMAWKWHLAPIFLSCVFHIAYYKGIGQVAQKRWYWILEYFFVFLITAILIEALFRMVSSWKYGKLTAISLVVLLSFGIMKPHWARLQKVVSYVPAGEHLYLKNVYWLEAHTEPGSVIGMTGAGSTGYFIQDRVVVNLDGLINSVAYFVHLQNATADQYFASIGGDYVFGNAYILQETNPYLWNFDQRLEFLQTYDKKDEYRHWALFRFK